MTETEDTELVQRSLEGDNGAFAELVERYQSTLYRLAYSMAGNREDAEDLCRDCFLHLHRVLPKYRAEFPFRAWFKRVATNLFINEMRSSRRREVAVEDVAGYLDSHPDVRNYAPDPADAVVQSDEASRILESVNRLPTNLRIPITLRYLEDMSFKDIAETLRIPMGTVSTRVRRGTELLRQAIRAEEG